MSSWQSGQQTTTHSRVPAKPPK